MRSLPARIEIWDLKFVALAALLSCCGVASGAPLTSGADFLLMTTGARPDGMGQAFSAVADDINTLSFNPAGLGNIRLPEVGYSREQFPGGIDFNFVGAALPMGSLGVLGLGYLHMGTAPFDSTGGGGPLVTVQEQAFQAGWGVSLYDLHLGVSAKYILRDLDGVQGSGLGLDLGFRLRVLPTWTLAGSILNLGAGVSFPGSNEPLPTSARFGTALALVEEEGSRLEVALDASWNIASNTQVFGGGAEYRFAEVVSLRGGYAGWSRDGELHLDGLSGGAGLRVGFLQLDYAFQPFNTFGSIHRFSGLLRWDGPWVKGVEPNAPKYVTASMTHQGLEVRWEPPQGPSAGYRILVEPLDGRQGILSPKVTAPRYLFAGLDPGSLYKVSVRTVGEGGVMSFPSPEGFFKAGPNRRVPPPVRSGSGLTHQGTGGFTGEVDAVGLKLSWDPVPGAKGYHLYRQDPSGRVERATLSPRKAPPLWIGEPLGLEGWTFMVTALLGDGRERTLGSLLWEPTQGALALLRKIPGFGLKASPQPDSKVFLDWDRDPGAAGFTLFVSPEPDGILEHYKDYRGDVWTDYFPLERGAGPKFFFLVAPKGPNGSYSGRSNLSGAELFH